MTENRKSGALPPQSRKRDGLPRCLYLKRGRYWLVKKSKWHDRGTEREAAQLAYHERVNRSSKLDKPTEAADTDNGPSMSSPPSSTTEASGSHSLPAARL